MRQLRIALLGYGVAGQAFAQILRSKQTELMADSGYDVRVTVIVTGSGGTLRSPDGIDLADATRQLRELGHFDVTSPHYSPSSAMEVITQWDYDVLIELTPIHIFSGQPATQHIRLAMERGKHVITANKGPIAWNYESLKKLAAQQNVCFFFETTVMTGTPLFNMAEHFLQYCRISRIDGLLNVTSNYVLQELEKGLDWETILKNGRESGFMEADPSVDLQGWDAAVKLTTLMNVLMGANTTPDQIHRTGVADIAHADIAHAKENGCRLKLLCQASMIDGGVVGTVSPTQRPADHPYCCDNIGAVVTLSTDLMGDITLIQHNLEPSLTGYGIFSDLVRVLDHINV